MPGVVLKAVERLLPVVAALGRFDETQQKNLSDYLSGSGAFERQGPGFFQSPAEAARIAGLGGDAGAFNSQISALRIRVTVHDGRTIFRLAAVVAPPGGATTVQTTAAAQRASSATNGRGATATNRPNAMQANNAAGRQGGNPNASSGANARNLRYPFTLLEIRENDEIPPAPPPPPDPKL